MKYMCRTCKKECDDILEHLMTVHRFSKATVESQVHRFSKATVESQLQTNPKSYDNSFVKLK